MMSSTPRTIRGANSIGLSATGTNTASAVTATTALDPVLASVETPKIAIEKLPPK